LTTLHDANEIIAVYGDNPMYQVGGTYYIRARPDFALYDLISDREYKYNMYVGSMTPASFNEKERAYETLELGQEYFGFANNSRYQDYRYFQMDTDAVYNITCKRLPGLGYPKFYVKMMDSDSSSWPPTAVNRDFESAALTPYTQNLTLTKEERSSRLAQCASYKTSQQGNGKQYCVVAISVTCLNGDDGANLPCAYKLQINQMGVDSTAPQSATAVPTGQFVPQPPGPILQNEYTNGKVS